MIDGSAYIGAISEVSIIGHIYYSYNTTIVACDTTTEQLKLFTQTCCSHRSIFPFSLVYSLVELFPPIILYINTTWQ